MVPFDSTYQACSDFSWLLYSLQWLNLVYCCDLYATIFVCLSDFVCRDWLFLRMTLYVHSEVYWIDQFSFLTRYLNLFIFLPFKHLLIFFSFWILVLHLFNFPQISFLADPCWRKWRRWAAGGETCDDDYDDDDNDDDYDDYDDYDDIIRIVLDCAAERIRDILMQAQQVGMMTGQVNTPNIHLSNYK